VDQPHTLGQWTRDVADRTPDKVAVDDGATTLTYRELDRRATRLARVLRRHPPGSRIATLTRNSADHVVLFFACAKARLVLVPLSWRLSAREIAAQLAHAEPALLLVEPDFAELAPGVPLGPAGIESDAVAGELDDPPRDDDPLLMLYTSGTSGRPKGVVLDHANCFWTNLSLSRAIPLSRDDVVLAVLPQFHVGGWNVQPLLAWWVGATVLLERGFDAGRALRLIGGRSVTTMMGVPTNYLFLAEHPDFAGTDLAGLRHAVVGGAPMPEALVRTWHERGVALIQGYGLTEAAPNVLCAGRPYPYVEVALDRTGELLVRGPNVFRGYWRNEDATAHALRDGWLHTGDLAHSDADGRYHILDRVDDMFVSGGENVFPSEVENVLYGHPAVAEVAVVGRPDERWGRVGLAYVVRRPGSCVSEDELIGRCRADLAGYQVPREIRFVDELPHSAVGKLLRRNLRQEGVGR